MWLTWVMGYFVVSVDGCSVYSERRSVWHSCIVVGKEDSCQILVPAQWNSTRTGIFFGKFGNFCTRMTTYVVFNFECFLAKARWSRLRVSQYCAAHSQLWERASSWRIQTTPCTLEICATLKASITMKNSSCDLDFAVWTIPCVERQWAALSVGSDVKNPSFPY